MTENNKETDSDYVDHQGLASQIVNQIELTQSSAVIGITGVQGSRRYSTKLPQS
jgi:putative protein kinase ArgK-like GTPase of G3E family